jgi:hypothetical protein
MSFEMEMLFPGFYLCGNCLSRYVIHLAGAKEKRNTAILRPLRFCAQCQIADLGRENGRPLLDPTPDWIRFWPV